MSATRERLLSPAAVQAAGVAAEGDAEEVANGDRTADEASPMANGQQIPRRSDRGA